MKIKCYLTDSTEYNTFCCFENGIYTLKISKNSNSWYYDLCDLIDFYKNSNIQIFLDIAEADVVLARRLYKNHKYNECRLREYETKVLVHSTPIENLESILKSRKLKSWNILKQETPDWEKEPIGKQLGDIDDFSNYVMLSMLFQNNEIVTASKQKHRINIDVNQLYKLGVRFYLNAEKLAADGLLLRDGEHIKVRDFIPLDEYLIWYSTTEKLEIKKEWTPKEFFDLSNKKFSELY